MTHRPERSIAIVGEAHRELLGHLDSLADAPPEPAGPSALPGWSLGHVLTHLARNADGLARVLAGCDRGESVEQYVGGVEGREAGIAEGAGRAWDALVDDVRATAATLEAQLDRQAEWAGGGTNSFGSPLPVADIPFLRCREVFIHHADLGLDGYGPPDWPIEYVREELRRQTMSWNARKPMGGTGLPAAAMREPELRRLLWLLGRADIAGLDPAGIF